MDAILAEFVALELQRARADEISRACELCRARDGVRFVEHYWACDECAWQRVMLCLRMEQARTSPAFTIQEEEEEPTND